jgi:hypothetical protein
MKIKLILIYITSAFVLICSCNKSNTPLGTNSTSFKGKYNGPMLQNGPGSFKDYKTGPLTFEVFDVDPTKISIQFSSNQFIADADLIGNNYKIIPKTIEYGATRVDISGFGYFKTDSMYIVWTQKQFTKSGSIYNYLDSMQFRGTLKKL